MDMSWRADTNPRRWIADRFSRTDKIRRVTSTTRPNMDSFYTLLVSVNQVYWTDTLSSHSFADWVACTDLPVITWIHSLNVWRKYFFLTRKAWGWFQSEQTSICVTIGQITSECTLYRLQLKWHLDMSTSRCGRHKMFSESDSVLHWHSFLQVQLIRVGNQPRKSLPDCRTTQAPFKATVFGGQMQYFPWQLDPFMHWTEFSSHRDPGPTPTTAKSRHQRRKRGRNCKSVLKYLPFLVA